MDLALETVNHFQVQASGLTVSDVSGILRRARPDGNVTELLRFRRLNTRRRRARPGGETFRHRSRHPRHIRPPPCLSRWSHVRTQIEMSVCAPPTCVTVGATAVDFQTRAPRRRAAWGRLGSGQTPSISKPAVHAGELRGGGRGQDNAVDFQTALHAGELRGGGRGQGKRRHFQPAPRRRATWGR